MRPRKERSTLYCNNYLDTVVENPITAYLILNGDQQILVDAGFWRFLGPTLGNCSPYWRH
ncbi:hypothetical protein [Chitinophaga pinensis]|uniref:Uncharacterized protein n=1 Tax=Chitinophaga pinensis TaxID=79329 RepID=A0A5C6M2C4_9BACT|nr:hypothetical protein [Chitinophaga pinensis]TWW01916.1 hypothetical protein FEF09_04955 [Chitinophaga pinensis]